MGQAGRRARTFHDGDANLAVLAGRTVAVIGYGNQGHAQAQNLRDSGAEVIVGNRDDDYREKARADGFGVLPIAEAARRGQVVLLLIPDEVQPEVMAAEVGPGLAAGDTLVVASGYNVTFGLLSVPGGVDVVMVAPRMIGVAVRDRFVRAVPFPCFISAEHDATGGALATALAVARGIGGTTGGAVLSSAREEAALDLFSEQAIWPTLFATMQASYEVLAAAGFSDDAILDEMYLSGEPAEVFARAAQLGLVGQLHTHSRTSQYGQLGGLARSGDLVAALRGRFSAVLSDHILSGAFARDWSGRLAGGEDPITALREQAAAHPLITAEEKVRGGPGEGGA